MAASTAHGPRGRKRRSRVLLVVLVIAISLLTVLLVDPQSPYGPRTECAVHDWVATERVYTPEVALANPFLGRASFNFSDVFYDFHSGGMDVGSSVPNPLHVSRWYTPTWSEANGSVEVSSIWNITWQVFSVRNTTVWGGASNGACSTRYVAQASFPTNGLNVDINFPWQGPGNQSDLTVPYSEPGFNSSFYPTAGTEEALLDVRFHSSNVAAVDTCGQSGVGRAIPRTISIPGPVSVPIGIPFEVGGVQHVVWGSLEWESKMTSSPTLVYSFAAEGVWQTDSVSGDSLGFYAFDYHPCP